jgi:transposase
VGFVGGDVQQRFVERFRDVDREQALAVAIDVGKSTAAALVCDFWGQLIGDPIEFTLNEPGFARLKQTISRAEAERDAVLVRVGLEQAGHYHQTLQARLQADGMDVVLFNPAQVKENRAQALARSAKSDRRDLCAMADLIARGMGRPPQQRDDAMARQAALAAHRRRKVRARTALKNQVLGSLDLVFPGLDSCFHDLLGTKVGRVMLREGLDPTRVRRLGPGRLRSMCAKRGVILKHRKAHQIVDAAKSAFLLPAVRSAAIAQTLATDIELLDRLDAIINDTELAMAEVLPLTPAAILQTMPSVGVVRATNYGAALGDPHRFRSASQVYRMSGLVPRMYESAGVHRQSAGISREGKADLRHAIIDLGIALRQGHPDFRAYAAAMLARGKRNGVVMCALGHRANRVAFVMIRDQVPFDPDRWGDADGCVTARGRNDVTRPPQEPDS